MDMAKAKGPPRKRQKKLTTKKPPSPLQETFGRNVLAAREAAGLTQRELAERAGTSQNYVSDIEKAVRNVTLSMVTRYARALGVSEGDLLMPKPEESLEC